MSYVLLYYLYMSREREKESEREREREREREIDYLMITFQTVKLCICKN